MSPSGIVFLEQQVPRTFRDRERLRAWLRAVAKDHGHPLGQLSFVLMSDEALQEYNHRFLAHEDLTDVITFPAESEQGVSGDILMSRDRIKENAGLFGVPMQQELHRVMVHGLLHLLGHTDKTKAQRNAMRAQEDLYLAKLG